MKRLASEAGIVALGLAIAPLFGGGFVLMFNQKWRNTMRSATYPRRLARRPPNLAITPNKFWKRPHEDTPGSGAAVLWAMFDKFSKVDKASNEAAARMMSRINSSGKIPFVAWLAGAKDITINEADDYLERTRASIEALEPQERADFESYFATVAKIADEHEEYEIRLANLKRFFVRKALCLLAIAVVALIVLSNS